MRTLLTILLFLLVGISWAQVDTDTDGVVNISDIDADNDGIPNSNETTSGLNPNNDSDGDGTVDYLDSDFASCGTFSNGVCSNFDSDGDGYANHLDIDSDNDGITDNTEALPTATYVAPVSSDTDGDGLDDAYDADCNPCGAVTGVAITPEDTDGDGIPDFLDHDADEDNFPDHEEGHDTDVNGSPDAGSPANTGVSDGVTDADNDGLLDGYDNVVGTWDATNGGVTPSSHPDAYDPGGEMDWRAKPDKDGDGIVNDNDIDDDNDGILDVNEGGITYYNSQPGCGSAGSYSFSNAPTLLSGTALSQGAVYRFASVASGVDAIVTIEKVVNATVPTIDDNASDAYAFKPQTAFSGLDNGDSAFVQYNLAFVVSGTYTPVASTDYFGNFSDIDGSNSYGEQAWFTDPASYTVAGATQLTMEVVPDGQDWLRATSGNTEVNGVDTVTKTVNISSEFVNTSNFRVRFGVVARANNVSSSGRQHRFEVNCIQQYPTPTTVIYDYDRDGLSNWVDLDSDNDGIPDVLENLGTDPDSNGVIGTGASAALTDTDGDGLADVVDATPATGPTGSIGSALANFDADVGPNLADYDSDSDGITDLVESGVGTDSDNNGVVDGLADNDHDGIVDSADGDDNGYGTTSTVYENTDGDGQLNSIDLDSDNDGIADLMESGLGSDANNDGMTNGTADFDGDGILDSSDEDPTVRGSGHVPADSDGDGLPNYLDLDSDNDGYTDFNENLNGTGTDADSNGIVDGAADNDGDGVLNSADSDDATTGTPNSAPNDSDGDGFYDFMDVDSDGDGIIDNIEIQATTGTPVQATGTDADANGLDDNFGSTGLLNPQDTDGDGTPDYLDNNSDNDGYLDVLEGWDTDGNYIANSSPSGSDGDNDGLDDTFDDVVGPNAVTNASNNAQSANDFPNMTTYGTPERDWREASDTDHDGITDDLDIDNDNDGMPDEDEAGGNEPDGDEDGDEILNWIDAVDDGNGGDGSVTSYTDANGDGIPDVYDFDRDGRPNHLDKDSDNDGIADIIEAGGQDDNMDGEVDYPTAGVATSMTDADSDGFSDDVDDRNGAVTNGTPLPVPNTDGTGGANYKDIDSDGDGIVDNIEAQATTGAPVVPGGADSDLDGIDNNFDPDDGGTYLSPVNNEGSDNPDYMDTDSDNDGEADAVEGWDSDGNGSAETMASGSDSDGDGLDNAFDDVNGINATTNVTNGGQDALDFPDADGGAGERDWREIICAGGTLALAPADTTTTATWYCGGSGWTYYFNPGDSTELLFAIEHQPAGGNTNNFTAVVSLTVSSNPLVEQGVYSATNVAQQQATFVMGRYWNITLTGGTLNGPVNIRFYYNPAEADTLEAVAERWNTEFAGSTMFVSQRMWFAMNTGTFDHQSADLASTGIQNSAEITPSTSGVEDGISYVQFNGLNVVTGGGMAYTIGNNSVVLPLELLHFNAIAENREVALNWATSTESASDRFDVERSADGRTWEKISEVAAAGNSNSARHYTHRDPDPLRGTSYYRLRLTDMDQSFVYSNMVTVNMGGMWEPSVASIYPNPNSGSFYIRLEGDPDQTLSLELYNAMGQVCRQWKRVHPGDPIEVDGLHAGSYMLVVGGIRQSSSHVIVAH